MSRAEISFSFHFIALFSSLFFSTKTKKKGREKSHQNNKKSMCIPGETSDVILREREMNRGSNRCIKKGMKNKEIYQEKKSKKLEMGMMTKKKKTKKKTMGWELKENQGEKRLCLPDKKIPRLIPLLSS